MFIDNNPKVNIQNHWRIAIIKNLRVRDQTFASEILRRATPTFPLIPR